MEEPKNNGYNFRMPEYDFELPGGNSNGERSSYWMAFIAPRLQCTKPRGDVMMQSVQSFAVSKTNGIDYDCELTVRCLPKAPPDRVGGWRYSMPMDRGLEVTFAANTASYYLCHSQSHPSSLQTIRRYSTTRSVQRYRQALGLVARYCGNFGRCLSHQKRWNQTLMTMMVPSRDTQGDMLVSSPISGSTSVPVYLGGIVACGSWIS